MCKKFVMCIIMKQNQEKLVCMSKNYGLIAIRLQSSIRKCFTGTVYTESALLTENMQRAVEK
jgi:hypothetical protein